MKAKANFGESPFHYPVPVGFIQYEEGRLVLYGETEATTILLAEVSDPDSFAPVHEGDVFGIRTEGL